MVSALIVVSHVQAKRRRDKGSLRENAARHRAVHVHVHVHAGDNAARNTNRKRTNACDTLDD